MPKTFVNFSPKYCRFSPDLDNLHSNFSHDDETQDVAISNDTEGRIYQRNIYRDVVSESDVEEQNCMNASDPPSRERENPYLDSEREVRITPRTAVETQMLPGMSTQQMLAKIYSKICEVDAKVTQLEKQTKAPLLSDLK
jgi:hypothetical protein